MPLLHTDSFKHNKLLSVPETMPLPGELSNQDEGEEDQQPVIISMFRSKSFESGEPEEYEEQAVSPVHALMGINLPEHKHDDKKIEELIHDGSKSVLQVNRNLYRAHRQMRLGVLEACKRSEENQFCRLQKQHQQKQKDAAAKPVGGAGLVMRHGHAEKLSTEAIRDILQKRQKDQELLLQKANKLSGRGGKRQRDRRMKTVSDMSAMLASNNSQASEPSPKKAQTPSPNDKNLMVHQTSNFKLSVDSRSCPPSPAIEALQNTPFVPNPSKTLPFLPSMAMDGNTSPMGMGLMSAPTGMMSEPKSASLPNLELNNSVVSRRQSLPENVTPDLKTSLKDYLENHTVLEEDESNEGMNNSNGVVNNDLTEELTMSLKNHLENQLSNGE